MRIDDGFATLIEFDTHPNVRFWEKEVTPPGMSGGGPNNTTTMRNVAMRTMAPKKLKTLTSMKATCAYDPAVLDDCFEMIQINQLITVHFADDSTWTFWGFLDEFKPNQCQEGSQPTAEITIEPTNFDESLVEVAPVYAA